MIEISHQQAHRLLRQGLDDRPLPEEQWSMLQAHLEGCPACRAYAAGLTGSQRELGRVLRGRWNAPGLSAQAGLGLSGQVTAARRRKLARWQAARRLLPGAALVVLVTGFFIFLQWRQSMARLAAPTPTAWVEAAPTTTPTPAGPVFRGLLAYTAEQDGSAEIFLLNRSGPADTAAVEITNLTQHPAQDIAPAWSPDGEWIAFLSDRAESGGRFELYVMTVAGTRLTRLTAREDVTWAGPLAWSASGDTIAMVGRRGSGGGDAFIFFVPIAGEEAGGGARTLGFTREVTGPLRFSTTAPLLAYADSRAGDLLVYNRLDHIFSAIRTGLPPQGSPPVAEGDFDWSPDGQHLAYLFPEFSSGTATGQTVQRLRLSNEVRLGAMGGTFGEENTLLASGAPGSMRSVSWMPSRYRNVLAFLQRASYTPVWVQEAVISGSCWTLRLLPVSPEGRAEGAAREVEGLCIDSPLGPSSWSQEGEWLLVSGFRPGEARMGIYALQMPRDPALAEPVIFDRLADAPPAQDSGLFHAYPPLVRPSTGQAVRGIPIDPRPAETGSARAGAAAPTVPASIEGRLLYNVVSEDSRTATLRRMVDLSDGAPLAPGPGLPEGAKRLLDGVGVVTCPSGQPGGDGIAFLSDAAGTFHGGPELLVADEEGSNMRRLTDRSAERRPMNIVWGCPVWSPDGTRLALTTEDGVENSLRILPLDGSQPTQIEVGVLSQTTLPVWSPDGRSVALVTRQAQRGPLRINLVDVTASPPYVGVLYETASLDDVVGLVFSPSSNGHDSPRIAFIGANYAVNVRLQLYSMHTNGSGLELLSELPQMEFQGWMGAQNLSWRGDRTIFFAIRHRSDALVKTSLWEYDTTERQRRPLALIEDMIISSAWSPGGRWLAFSSDGGLYLLDWQAARRGEAVSSASAPLLISRERVYDVDWK